MVGTTDGAPLSSGQMSGIDAEEDDEDSDSDWDEEEDSNGTSDAVTAHALNKALTFLESVDDMDARTEQALLDITYASIALDVDARICL